MDVSNSNKINFLEFIELIQEPLPPIRAKMIDAVFSKIEKKQNGRVGLDVLTRNYNPANDPMVVKGVVTPQQSFKAFVENIKIYCSYNVRYAIIRKLLIQVQILTNFNSFWPFIHRTIRLMNNSGIFYMEFGFKFQVKVFLYLSTK